MKHALLPAVALTLAVLTGCSSTTPARPAAPTTTTAPSATATPSGLAETSQPASSELREVVGDLDVPWSIVFVDRTALFSERDSDRILELTDASTTREVGRLSGVQHLGGEGGLLGLAVDDRQRIYAYSSGPDGNRVQRFDLDGRPGSYQLSQPTTVIDHLPSGRYHNGGRIAFGPDHLLYVAVGDTQRSRSAQDLDSLGGKILRMTTDGRVPADNPFPGSYVYSYGHRNVQGMAWAADGTMFASEFGENTWDELNIITAGGNYGWPDTEGRGGRRGQIDPVQQWHPADASPSGLAIIDDTIYIANLRGQVLRVVPVADPSRANERYDGDYGRLRAVVAAPDETLWISTSNTDGIGSPQAGDDRILSVPTSQEQ